MVVDRHRHWIVVVALSIGLSPSGSLAHTPAGRTILVPHVETPPAIDGSLSDWSGIQPTLDAADFTDLVGATNPDPVDFDMRVWLAWNEVHNRLYVAAETSDDVHQIDRPEGSAATRIFLDDGLEIFIDADHSGGQYADFSELPPDEQLARNGTEANHFVLAGPHDDGDLFVNFSAAAWYSQVDGPFTQAALTFDGQAGGPGVTLYEFSIVPYNRLNITAEFLSAPHDLEAGQVLGFNLEFSDFDAQSDLFDAKWSLSGGFNAPRLSERFVDIQLEAPDRPTAVKDLSWGRIKASFQP